VRGVVFSLLAQDLFSVLEVTETANFGATGFAAPTEAVPGPRTAMVLGQGLALVTASARLGLQGSDESSFSIARAHLWRRVDALIREKIEVPSYFRLTELILSATNRQKQDLATAIERTHRTDRQKNAEKRYFVPPER
jgi:hypothetical protein